MVGVECQKHRVEVLVLGVTAVEVSVVVVLASTVEVEGVVVTRVAMLKEIAKEI